MLVAEVIPNPPRTHLVKDAERVGWKVIDGLEMLVNQGVIGIEYWTGVNANPMVMRAALEEVFARGLDLRVEVWLSEALRSDSQKFRFEIAYFKTIRTKSLARLPCLKIHGMECRATLF